MRLTGTVTIVNSLAHSQGYGANSKLGRPCKCVLQIRKRGDGRDVLVLSTRTDIGGREYDVRNIAVLRTMFLNEGRATIEIKQPPMNLMLRDCKPEDLMAFMDDLKSLHAGKKLIVTSASSSNAQNEVPRNEVQESLASLRKGRPTKRARSPELSKNEKTKIKRTLDASCQTINVKDRAKYPKEILPTIEKISIQGIRLKEIDRRFLKLKWLHKLDLSGNSIENITELTKLNSFLKSLVIAKNQIFEIPDDIFNAPPFQKLEHLDLSGNQLRKLPSSVLNLQTLTSFYISGNKLSYLPYNWMDMKSLRILNVAQNRLLFVPATLLYLHLTSFDMSGNPDLYRSDNNMDPDHVGLSCVPTLFEMACEVVMNEQRKNKVHPSENASLPSVVQSYLQGGKYCIECCKKTLRYIIIKGSVLPSSFNRGTMSACEVSPALSSCFIKKIICPSCDSRYRNSRVSRIV